MPPMTQSAPVQLERYPSADAAIIASMGEPTGLRLDLVDAKRTTTPPMPSPPNKKLGFARTTSVDTEMLRQQHAKKAEQNKWRAAGLEDQVVEEETLSRTDVLLNLLPPEQLADMREVFNVFDDDDSGEITIAEVSIVLRRMNLVPSNKMLKLVVEVIDVDGDGHIDFGEFVALMTQRRKPMLEEDEEEGGDGYGNEGGVDAVAGAADAALGAR